MSPPSLRRTVTLTPVRSSSALNSASRSGVLGSKAVSYTHLHTTWETRWNSAEMPLSPPDSVIGSTYSAVSMVYTLQSGPVSYTHLDVYKRQVMSTASWRFEGDRTSILKPPLPLALVALSLIHI